MAKRRNWVEGRAKVDYEGGCRVCGFVGAQAHHIVPRSLAGDDVADNFMPLCGTHHRAVHDHTLNIWTYMTQAEKDHAGSLMGAGGSQLYLDMRERTENDRAGIGRTRSS